MRLKISLIFVLASFAAFVNCQAVIDDVVFIKLGSFSKKTKLIVVDSIIIYNFIFADLNGKHVKSYFIPRYFKSQWVNAKSICQSYGMEFVSLETQQEADNFLGLCNRNTKLFEAHVNIGGMTLEGKSTDKWYWVNSRKHIDYPIAFAPSEPNFGHGLEFCLAVIKLPNDIFMFNDVACNGGLDHLLERQFICEKVDYHSVTGLEP
jgi:hypothetical protein